MLCLKTRATTENKTRSIVGSVRCVQETGGNAILQSKEKGTYEEQYLHVDNTSKQLYKFWEEGYKIVVTHGNGPQAGNLLIQQEEATAQVPAQTLHCVCLLYTSPSPRDLSTSRMPSSA
eukprot:TRINITY_DN71013_c0_g1_i1.p1 TRINITY_DN71013_c0_g1~~TRINITY_DN71013_c0_g1_i1.p1  ORF type:complete len:119 (+),score=29.19 TRINITY_DN71013_c0_g1_i1:29-385(+)